MFRKLTTQSNQNPVELSVEWADTFFSRFMGLMGRKEIDQSNGLVLVLDKESKINAAIHMLFMRFNIAVIWLSEDFKVIDKIIAKKWHLSYQPQAAAKYILETHPTNLTLFDIGDKIQISNEN
ncbi:MAG: DUF192 domain-containing protein [Anaerolineaceae bacterium]|nr:DUF192 domain-containing protein [Anaerolineaceae bacterium]